MTSLIHKKGMTILYENLSNGVTYKGDTEKTKLILAYSLSTLWT
ncbi:hypothetical protein ACIG6B_08505 [Bacillus mobilis]